MSEQSPNLPPAPAGKTGWPWTVDGAEVVPGGSSAWPKISITTPSYNQGDYIEETIRSVLLQGYPNLEYSIMDAGSKDGTVEIIKKYERWLAGWVSEKDKGQANAINKGWARSTGDVLAYINSDDVYYPGALFKAAKIFQQNPKAEWVAGEVNNGFSLQKIVNRHIPRPTTAVECLGRRNYGFHQPGMFWRRSMIERLGAFDEGFHSAFCHDFWMRSLLGEYQPYCLRELISFFRLHEGSQSVSGRALFMEDDWRIYHRYKTALEGEQSRQAKGWLEEYEADGLADIVYNLLNRKQRAKASGYLLRRLHLLPKVHSGKSAAGLVIRTFVTGRAPAWFGV
jgi:glycosyltransferase involved in cell wall biosynthesis